MREYNLSPTVYGIETEYSCMIRLPNEIMHEIVGSCHSKDAEIGLYQAPKRDSISEIANYKIAGALLETCGIIQTSNGMLSNGGRLYKDQSGLEYATPETTTAEEAVHRSFDGDAIVLSVLEYLRKTEEISSYQLNRRIVDHNRSSRGVHINTTTMIDRVEKEPGMNMKIATFNAVKGAIFGSGGLLIDQHGSTKFHASPRLSLTTSISSSEYKKRPLFRIPFKSDDDGLYRAESVANDALNFAWPLKANMVATNALFKLFELGYGDRLPIIPKPTIAARKIGYKGNETSVSITDHRDKLISVRPLEVLQEICEIILSVDENMQFLDDESKQVLPEIIIVSETVINDPESASDKVESIARKLAMHKKMEKDRIKLDDEKMCRFDYAWDWLGGGIAERLRQKNIAGWHGFSEKYSRNATLKRLSQPPKDTRAQIRGEVIKNSDPENRSDWSTIDYGSNDRRVYYHPLDTK